jgi:hypothetical protein
VQFILKPGPLRPAPVRPRRPARSTKQPSH